MELKFNELNWTEWKGERGREMAEHTEKSVTLRGLCRGGPEL